MKDWNSSKYTGVTAALSAIALSHERWRMLQLKLGSGQLQSVSATDSRGYFLAGRVFMMLSISLISRGALLILSSPRSVIT